VRTVKLTGREEDDGAIVRFCRGEGSSGLRSGGSITSNEEGGGRCVGRGLKKGWVKGGKRDDGRWLLKAHRAGSREEKREVGGGRQHVESTRKGALVRTEGGQCRWCGNGR
jgi:hypothetical protein